ncbi:MAG: tRNA (adenosine(37)-N6)-threonylcarbamoyltransferase complex dimerization subunit type 1 TsaB [Maribacter sp.]
MGLILNLETATTNCSVSLANDGEVLALKEHDTPNYSHSEQLHVFIQECMEKAGRNLSELDAIAVSKGPGSYTGLRIGVSAAKGLCFSIGVPLISIATLKSMAFQIKVSEGEFIIPVLDARRMEVYSAVFNSDLKQIRETRAEIIDEKSFEDYTKNQKVSIVGNGAEKIKPILKYPDIKFESYIIPSAKDMAPLSFKKYLEKDFENIAYFEPYYLKDFILQLSKK